MVGMKGRAAKNRAQQHPASPAPETRFDETVEEELLRTGETKRRRGTNDERRIASELIRQCEISTDTPEYLPLWEELLLLIAHTKEERRDLVTDAESAAEHREAWADIVDHWANEYSVRDDSRARVKIVVNNFITQIIGYESKPRLYWQAWGTCGGCCRNRGSEYYRSREEYAARQAPGFGKTD